MFTKENSYVSQGFHVSYRILKHSACAGASAWETYVKHMERSLMDVASYVCAVTVTFGQPRRLVDAHTLGYSEDSQKVTRLKRSLLLLAEIF